MFPTRTERTVAVAAETNAGAVVWATGLFMRVVLDASRHVHRLSDRRARRRGTDLRKRARR
jgi:hypothetical protein